MRFVHCQVHVETTDFRIVDRHEVCMSNMTEKSNENIEVYFTEDSVPRIVWLKLFLVNTYTVKDKTSTTQIHE